VSDKGGKRQKRIFLRGEVVEKKKKVKGRRVELGKGRRGGQAKSIEVSA